MSFESIREHIAAGWAIWLGTLIISYLLSLFLPYVLKSLGKDPEIKPEHKRRFHLVSTILIFIAITIIQHVDHQFEEIKNAPYKGRMGAGVLSVAMITNGASIETTAAISTNNRVPTMSGITTDPEVGNREGGCDLMVIMRIHNAGPPTAIWSWKAFVILPGGSRVQASIPGFSLMDGTVPTVIGPVHIGMDNNLLTLLSETPLASGAAKIGWFPIHINRINPPQKGTKIVICFEDIFGREVRVEHVWEVGK